MIRVHKVPYRHTSNKITNSICCEKSGATSFAYVLITVDATIMMHKWGLTDDPSYKFFRSFSNAKRGIFGEPSLFKTRLIQRHVGYLNWIIIKCIQLYTH